MTCSSQTINKKRLLPRANALDDGKVPVWDAVARKTVWINVPGIGPISASDVTEINAGSVQAAINDLYFQLSQAALLPIQSTDIVDGITGTLETTLQIYYTNFETIVENIDLLDATTLQEFYYGGTIQDAITNLAGNTIALPISGYDVTDVNNGYSSIQDAVNILFAMNNNQIPLDKIERGNGETLDTIMAAQFGYNGYIDSSYIYDSLFGQPINSTLSTLQTLQGDINYIYQSVLDNTMLGDLFYMYYSNPNFTMFSNSALGELIQDIDNRLIALENA